jgi:hypothetical protein
LLVARRACLKKTMRASTNKMLFSCRQIIDYSVCA